MSKKRLLALLFAATIAVTPLAGCESEKVIWEDVSDSTSGAQIADANSDAETSSDNTESGEASGTASTSASSRKGNTSKKPQKPTASAATSSKKTRQPSGQNTIAFQPIADKGANYNVKGTVKIAVDTARTADYDAMFDVMAKLYPNVKIELDYWTHKDVANASEYLTTRAATGTMADIIWDDAGCIASYIMQGWVYPITKFVNADPEASNIPANLKKDYTYGGELYALPHQANFDTRVFNTDILQKLNLKLPNMQWTPEEEEKYLKAAAARYPSGLCVGSSTLGDTYGSYSWWLSMKDRSSTRWGQFGFNYDTSEMNADYMMKGAQQQYKWETMLPGMSAWREWYGTSDATMGKTGALEKYLGVNSYDAAWTSGKALILSANTGLTLRRTNNWKFNYTVMPCPNEGGRMPMHVDHCFITSSCSDANIDAAFQLLRFMTYSSNGNLARLSMYDEANKGKYTLNSKLYYPTSSNKDVVAKFNSLKVADATDKYLVANIPNSGRYDASKLIPGFYDTFFQYVAPVLNNTIHHGQNPANTGFREAVAKFNTAIKKTINDMNAKIKQEQAAFNAKHK